ncbi:unnamed protein product, partial [Rotaria sordida]
PDELQKALDLIRVGKITVNDASKHYHILIVTLYSRLSGLRGSGKPGAKTILSNEEEKFLIYVIQKYQEWQYPLSRSDFISIARTFMIQLNKPNISDYSSLHCWFDHLHKVLFDLNLLDRPEAIYNVDELAFGDDPGRKQVIIKRNSKFATCIQGGSGKSYTTLLICISASGKFLPPYIIYRAHRLFDVWIPRNGFLSSRYNATSSGWNEEPVFFDWLCNHFVPAVKTVKKPMVLLMDGYHSHLSTRIIKYSMDHGIHLECLPPHTTNILQPLDVLTLSKMKRSWRELLSNHYKETNAETLTKQKFALLISNLFKNHLLSAHCSSGFSKAGVYPFDKRATSKEKLLQSATTSESNTSLFQSNTTDKIEDKTSSNTNVVNLRRSSSCPNPSSEDIK